MKSPISEIFGMQVYTDKAVLVGEVDDVVLNVDTKKIDALAVGKLNPEVMELKGFKGIKIPYGIVRAIGDIVIIRHINGTYQEDKSES